MTNLKQRLLNRSLLLSGALLATEAQAEPDFVYIVGVRYLLDQSDFVEQADNRWTLTMPVTGDTGGLLDFDIDVVIGGRGFYDTRYECIGLFFPASGQPVLGDGTPPYCHFRSIDPQNQFHYGVRVDVTCSGIDIGSKQDNQDETLSGSDVTAIADAVDLNTGDVVGEPFPRNRYSTLLLDRRLVTGGNCQELSVSLTGLNGTELDQIELDLIVAEVF